MNRINPLYLLALFCMLTAYSFSLLQEKKQDFLSHNEAFNQLSHKAKEYKSLKKNNINKNAVIKTINQITTDSRFKKAKINTKKSTKSISLKIQTQDFKLLNRFVNRVLNEKLTILKLEIKTNKINMEVGL